MANPIIEVTFTPAVNGTLVATATYSVQLGGGASDWGGSDPKSILRLRRTSDSVTLLSGDSLPASTTRMPQTIRSTFACLAANGEQSVRLEGSGGAPGENISYWDIDLTVELIKR